MRCAFVIFVMQSGFKDNVKRQNSANMKTVGTVTFKVRLRQLLFSCDRQNCFLLENEKNGCFSSAVYISTTKSLIFNEPSRQIHTSR